jgi:hypothetical protein
VLSAHTQFVPNGRRADRLRDHHGIHPGQIVYRASEPSLSNRWGAALASNSPGQTSRLNNGITDTPKEWQRSHASRDAPEPDSHFKRTTATTPMKTGQPLKRHDHTTQDALPEHMIKPNSGHSAIQPVPVVGASAPVERARLRGAAFIVCFANNCRRIGRVPVETVTSCGATPHLLCKCGGWRRPGSNR